MEQADMRATELDSVQTLCSATAMFEFWPLSCDEPGAIFEKERHGSHTLELLV